jgi:two-component system cell cycle response regulator DivK
MNDYLVLIVEDNDMNLLLARDVLQSKGFRTIEAKTAGEGIRLAEAEQPDIVLMDIQLPDMDGATALAKLRAQPQTNGLRVVALTAFAMRQDRDRLLRGGFDGYIAKPIDIKQFPDQVRRCCEGAKESV